jgi:hypothetical protein
MKRVLTLRFSLLLCYIPFFNIFVQVLSIALSSGDKMVGSEVNGVKWLEDDEQKRLIMMFQRKGKEDKRDKYNIDEWLGRIC